MHNRLKSIDPQSAERINENDSQRIQRALEVYEITGISMSELLAVGRAKAMILSPTKILLMPDDRAELHERIHKRFLICYRLVWSKKLKIYSSVMIYHWINRQCGWLAIVRYGVI